MACDLISVFIYCSRTGGPTRKSAKGGWTPEEVGILIYLKQGQGNLNFVYTRSTLYMNVISDLIKYFLLLIF
jgi:hypothetical protein